MGWFDEYRLDPNYGYCKPCEDRRYEDVLSYSEAVHKAVKKIVKERQEDEHII
jgi:hypothetical protein